MGAPAIIARHRRRIISHFLSQNAVTPETAVGYEPPRRIDRRLFERLREREVIRENGRGAYYIDAASLDSYDRSRRRVVGGVIAALAVAFGAAVAFG